MPLGMAFPSCLPAAQLPPPAAGWFGDFQCNDTSPNSQPSPFYTALETVIYRLEFGSSYDGIQGFYEMSQKQGQFGKTAVKPSSCVLPGEPGPCKQKKGEEVVWQSKR